MERFAKALQPYGYDYLVSATAIPGPGNMIIVFGTIGDFMAACVTRTDEVLWVLSCGGSDAEGYTNEANQVHHATRALFVS